MYWCSRVTILADVTVGLPKMGQHPSSEARTPHGHRTSDVHLHSASSNDGTVSSGPSRSAGENSRTDRHHIRGELSGVNSSDQSSLDREESSRKETSSTRNVVLRGLSAVRRARNRHHENPPTLISTVNEPYPKERRLMSGSENGVEEQRPSGSPTVAIVGEQAETLNQVDTTGIEVDPQNRRSSGCSSVVSERDDEEVLDFYPIPSLEYEWMGRSIESLLLGHVVNAPILQLLDSENGDDDDEDSEYLFRRRSTASTFGGIVQRRSSRGSTSLCNRRGSLSLSLSSTNGGPLSSMHGGTLARYYSRRRQYNPTDVDRSSAGEGGLRSSMSHGPVYRRRSSVAGTFSVSESVARTSSDGGNSNKSGPNVVLNLMARECTGRSVFSRGLPVSQCLRTMGGTTLYAALDKPSAGMLSEVAFLAAAIDSGDWSETATIVSRLAVRLGGDPNSGESRSSGINDPNLPPEAPLFYAGGGRLGLERDAFVLAGGVDVFIRLFREKRFVGQDMASSFDARDLSEEIVATRFKRCWDDVLATLRELVYYIPTLVTGGALDDNGDFLPFLFTLLSHDSCFDSAAALIEEILSFMSQTTHAASDLPGGRISNTATFYLGNVPDLFSLWRGFNCRQLAHFCRILALLVFEPEDRQLLESPAVLKSLELLQLRRNRASRSGRDSTVDMNQSILLDDVMLLQRLLLLLVVMNYAPPLRRFLPYHVLAHFPFIVDTLVWLGLKELDDFTEINRQNQLARKLLDSRRAAAEGEGADTHDILINNLGSVADMLESLSESLMGANSDGPSQIGDVFHVISAAQQAGVIVRRDQRDRRSQSTSVAGETAIGDEELHRESTDVSTIQGLVSAAGVLTDQILGSGLYPDGDRQFEDPTSDSAQPSSFSVENGLNDKETITSPEDAANCMQFNAMLLGPYQVEVLFVLCTLLGGRRKLDAQDSFNDFQIVSILDDMFQRLPWYKLTDDSPGVRSETDSTDGGREQPSGIHGPDCECTPESALCVQYLRLLHNFCDRDCDNYSGRRMLLSQSERAFIFESRTGPVAKGLLSKIIEAFINESDESPYRFWLASCIESYLRGSSPEEQVFVAKSGLLFHLMQDITSDRLHCAGSLQTSFDLLGELSKGNTCVVRLLVADLDETKFRKLMSIAAANLVDSNVFIRSLLLSLERPSGCVGETSWLAGNKGKISGRANAKQSYLTHSWWDTVSTNVHDGAIDDLRLYSRPTDWFHNREAVLVRSRSQSEPSSIVANSLPGGRKGSVGYFGWVFSPCGDPLLTASHLPNTLERLAWFISANQARLLRDLLGVVDLQNINHENICCLNTAVVVAIFAHRRRELPKLLEELRQLNVEEKEMKGRVADMDHLVDRSFEKATQYIEHERNRSAPAYTRRASIIHGGHRVGDRIDTIRNFREVLWFWLEYYTHRGRDRLSLEFSSHIRFQEWRHVVSLLTRDDGSPTSLVRDPVRVPRSPYQRASRRSAGFQL